MDTIEIIKKIDSKSLIAIKQQAEYNKSIDTKKRLETSFNHIEGLRNMHRNIKRK